MSTRFAVDNKNAIEEVIDIFRGGYFLASVLLKDKMIFLTISNSIPHVNSVSESECARSIALEILFSVTYHERFFL